MAKGRRWGVYAFRQLRGAPMVSLGVHLDLHTPRVDFHLPLWTVCIGRMVWEPGTQLLFVFDGPERWSGHMDDCWHREAMVEADKETKRTNAALDDLAALAGGSDD